MSYIALARKYRPKNFAELVGQGVLVATLTNAIEEGRVHHAFLLTGIRGVGKTTTARIIAKNLNCEKGETITPCEVCPNCVAIKNGSHPDVIEFDAASNTGIEDVKVIISSTHYAPIMGRKKVFIIDEIHMLSTKAFNALLKTLEEPPPNIVFIFATTESRKVPITILSRCQKFFLRGLKQQEISSHLKEVAKKEGFETEEEALEIISSKAGGSMRDALSMLDQAILNASGKNVLYSEVKDMLKIPTQDETESLFKRILNGEVSEAIEIMQTLSNSGLDEGEIVSDLLTLTAEKIKKEALEKEEFGMPNLIRLYHALTKGGDEMKSAQSKKQALEVLIIKLIYSWKLPSPFEIMEVAKGSEAGNLLKIFENSKLIGN
jgi:DNA polymerase-3 subunit gamma/tau